MLLVLRESGGFIVKALPLFVQERSTRAIEDDAGRFMVLIRASHFRKGRRAAALASA